MLKHVVEYHQICNFIWLDKCLRLSHTKTHLEQMMKDFIDEAEGWDLEPKPVSPWWTSIYADEKKEDMMIETK